MEGKRIRTDETPLLAGFRISVGQNTPTSRLCPSSPLCSSIARANICSANETCGPTERQNAGRRRELGYLGEWVQMRK